MHALKQDAISARDTQSDETMMFAGEGAELFGCYTLSSGSMHSGAGTELMGCYTQSVGSTLTGTGSELYGCYTA